MKRRRLAGIGVLLGPLLFLPGCQEQDLTVPTAEEAAEYYTAVTDLSVEMAGNVAEVTVVQSTAQLRRGGSLWARVGPYIYLFSDATRDLFVDFPGLAAVRVITTTSGGTEVARATLLRTTSGTEYFLANSTDRLCRTFAPRLASSSISSWLIVSILRASGTSLGSAV